MKRTKIHQVIDRYILDSNHPCTLDIANARRYSIDNVGINKIIPIQCNHKRIGIYYIMSVTNTLVSGLIYSTIIRQTMYLVNRLIETDNVQSYNLAITIHGLVMIFYVIMPGVYGSISNYTIPISILIPEITYPRINSIGFIIIPVTYIMIATSMMIEECIGPGWTLYPPLSTNGTGMLTVILIQLQLTGISSIISSINFIGTISLRKMNGIIPWTTIITGLLLIVTLPILTGTLLMLGTDINMNTTYYNNQGDPVLYQHLFWYFGHPEVYILIIPTFGTITAIISKSSNRPTFGLQAMILALVSISLIGLLVWGHHIFTIGMEIETKIYFTNISLIISLPTGTKIYNWLTTMSNTTNSLQLGITFITTFIIGGITGIILGNDILDIGLHDTYYIIAHFHYILSIGAIIGLWTTIIAMNSLMYRACIYPSICHTMSLTLGINMIFSPMFILGFNTLPRRITEYSSQLTPYNWLSTLGSTITIQTFTLLLNPRH